MQENNNEAFMGYFNDIETFFNEKYKPDRGKQYYSFYELVENASRYDRYVKLKKDTFQVLGDLRNFLSHGNQKDLVIITDESLDLIKEVHGQLLRPITAFDIKTNEVKFFEESSRLAAVLDLIRTKDYTKFPIKNKNNEVVGLLTDNGITHWLAQHAEEGTVSLGEATARDILALDENKNNFAFIKREATIYDAEAEFKDKNIEALLVTQNGNNNEPILGIITRVDLLEQFK